MTYNFVGGGKGKKASYSVYGELGVLNMLMQKIRNRHNENKCVCDETESFEDFSIDEICLFADNLAQEKLTQLAGEAHKYYRSAEFE